MTMERTMTELIEENEKLCKRINELREKIKKLEEQNAELSKLCGVNYTNG